MKKPAELRRILTEALPELATSPENLIIFIPDGSIKTSAKASLNHRCDYTLVVNIKNYSGNFELSATLLNWLFVNQFDRIQRPEFAKDGLNFDVTFVDHTRQDITFYLDLSESIVVKDTIENGQPKRTIEYAPNPKIPAFADYGRLPQP